MRLPANWERFLEPYINIDDFYLRLDAFCAAYPLIIPAPRRIFHVFERVAPEEARVVLFGEDPYPRRASANGIAFWDMEIRRWDDKTRGNSLKNMLKALLTARGWCNYATPIAQCRAIANSRALPAPDGLFEYWLNQGVFLLNTALTFSTAEDKKHHFAFWRVFHSHVIAALNARDIGSPFYILWGNKAAGWEEVIRRNLDNPDKIIRQGHPTFIHQFMDKNRPHWSPFTEIEQKTGFAWLP